MMTMAFDPFKDLDLARALLGARRGPRTMSVDMYRDHDTYVMNADLPGIYPGSVDVDVDGNLLTIRAERSTASADGVKWLLQERESGSYLRQFQLGDGVDAASITARYDDGVLSVIIPVAERAKSRKITVESSAHDSQEAINA